MQHVVKKCKGCNLENFNQTWKIFSHLPKDFLVNYSLNPEVDGHLVIQSRFHVRTISNLSEEQSRVLGSLIRNYCRALEKTLRPRPEKIYIYSFNEAKSYHLHFHLKPRSPKVPDDVRGAKFVDWSDKEVKTDRRSVERIKQKIERAVKKHR